LRPLFCLGPGGKQSGAGKTKCQHQEHIRPTNNQAETQQKNTKKLLDDPRQSDRKILENIHKALASGFTAGPHPEQLQ
jgi:hypothetical protein